MPPPVESRVQVCQWDENIDDIYDIAIKSGAIGGKLCGAGGGGFILFFVPLEKQKLVKEP